MGFDLYIKSFPMNQLTKIKKIPLKRVMIVPTFVLTKVFPFRFRLILLPNRSIDLNIFYLMISLKKTLNFF
jgi:hypothetical protein